MNISYSDSVLDPQLIRAYLETNYNVYGQVSMSLRVGVANPRLAALHKANNIVTSSFITAVNPFSKTLPDDTNAKRQALLVEELKQRNLVFIGGIGLHSSGKWPGEPSFLALGLDLHSAKMLGAKFEQNAVVWIGNNAVPQLILLR